MIVPPVEINVPPLPLRVILRAEEKGALASRLPPLMERGAAAFPKLESEEILIVPALIVVVPV